MSLLLFAFLTFGLCFLLADAHLFGCDAQFYNEVSDDCLATRDMKREAEQRGILKIRQHFLKLHFFRRLLGCYFCMGVWVGPLVHTYLYHTDPHYFWLHDSSPVSWLLGLFGASVLGGATSLIINSALDAMSKN